MKKIQFIFIVLLFSTSALLAQTVIGVVQDETGGLPGVNIIEKGTQNGTSTDFDGKFSLDVNSTKGIIEVSFVGMSTRNINFSVSTGETVDLGTIILAENQNVLDEVVVTGVVDFAKERETPVAVSTIRAVDIQQNLGTQELPEILNVTPSVYATKQGGGFGDSRINIRGFDQRNTAVMINGMPVNDMENGWVYWSNWAGLADVTTAMQVQRGLGSSKLAISSVGGTINVLTRTAMAREGGAATFTFGNDGYAKETASYSTGLMENGFSTSVLLSHTAGDGYVDGTKGDGWNYFIGLGYKLNDQHDFQFIFTGAPQWHHQRYYAPAISSYIKYGNNGKPNDKYNEDWGFKNGKEYSFRRNFYHKPIMSLNWEWDISEASKLSSVFYASWGRGGGTGEIGRINGTRQYALPRDAKGLIRVDDIVAWNSGQSVPDFANPAYNQPTSRTPFNGSFVNTGNDGHPDGEGRYGSDNGISSRASMNSHDWYGTVINFSHEINENWNFDVGTDLRTYTGYHFRVVNDVLGADSYTGYDNINDPIHSISPNDFEDASPSWNPWQNIKDMEKIDYYNDGKVNWSGIFGQVEYSNDYVSTFIQTSLSNQKFQRVEKFNELPGNQKSEKVSQTGGSVKGGINWNIDESNNVFFNTGYYSKQPLFDAVFLNFGNNVNPDLTNEKIFGIEAGYGFKTVAWNINANLYRTSWKDRYISTSVNVMVGDEEIRGSAEYKGVEQVHTGLEIDFLWRTTDKLRFNGMISIGNWEYGGDVKANVYDSDQTLVGTSTLYLDGVKVGDAAQFTAALAANYSFLKGFNFGMNWRLASDLYANISPEAFNTPGHEGSLKLPSFNLFDARLSYNWKFENDNSLRFGLNVNNLFDELYISESDTNYHAGAGDDTWEGINTSNRVFFGWGRTWNASVTYRF